MKISYQQRSLVAATATWVALGLLAALVFVSCAALIPLSESMATGYPEFRSLRVPLLTIALAVGLCVEVILVSTAVLVRFIRRDRIFNPAAQRLVNMLSISVLTATIATGATLAFIPGPPLLAIMIIASVLVGITLFFVLLVLKSLLRRTALMRAELDEVV